MIIWCLGEQKLKKHQILIIHFFYLPETPITHNLMGKDCSTPITRFFHPNFEKTWKYVHLVYHVFGVKLEKLDNV